MRRAKSGELAGPNTDAASVPPYCHLRVKSWDEARAVLVSSSWSRRLHLWQTNRWLDYFGCVCSFVSYCMYASGT